MYELVLTKRRVLAGLLVAAVVVLVGSRFLLHGPSASSALERPIVGSADVGACGLPAGRHRRRGSSCTWSVPCGGRGSIACRPGRRRRRRRLARGRPDSAGRPCRGQPRRAGRGRRAAGRARAAARGGRGRAGAPVDGVGGAAPAGPVQLSVATAEQLDALPGSDRSRRRRSSSTAPRTVPSAASTSWTRSRASARRASSSCAVWWCRDDGVDAAPIRTCSPARPASGSRLERGARSAARRCRGRPSLAASAACSRPRRSHGWCCSRSRSPSRGWWWGSAAPRRARLRACSLPRVGEAGAALRGRHRPARAAESSTCAFRRRLRRFGALALREPVLLDLPVGRSPPQGALIALARAATLAAAGLERLRRADVAPPPRRPRRRPGPTTGGSSVGAAGSAATPTGSGAGSRAERRPGSRENDARSWKGSSSARTEACRPASARLPRVGLYHLLAVSGQNVIFVAACVLGLALAAPRSALARRARRARRDRLVRARRRRRSRP